MQKNNLFWTIRTEVVRGVSFWLAFAVTILISIGGVAYAANAWGAFGEALNKILASSNWQAPGDGTVKNAKALGGKTVDQFAKIGSNRTCPENQCVYGIATNGNVLCR